MADSQVAGTSGTAQRSMRGASVCSLSTGFVGRVPSPLGGGGSTAAFTDGYASSSPATVGAGGYRRFCAAGVQVQVVPDEQTA